MKTYSYLKLNQSTTMNKKQDENRGNIIEVRFTQENRLSYKENNLKFTMTSTKIEADKFKQYFGCIHPYSATSTRPKCT